MFRNFWILLLLFPALVFAQKNSTDLSYRYLKFHDVPTEEQKAILKSLNVQLHQYKPDLVWMASMPPKVKDEVLIKAGVKTSYKALPRNKLDPRVWANNVPEYAEKEGGILAFITVAKMDDYTIFIETLTQLGISTNSTFEPLGILEVIGSRKALVDAVKLDFVIYIELPEPPAELEIEDEMTMTRAPFINGYYSLNGVNGNGVTIAVNEGGRVDSIYSPDYKNRLDRTFETGTNSGHKTGVSMRMCSAGNLNPVHRGQAWGANLWSGGINFTNAAQANVNIVNNSFGYGCISGNATYNTAAAINDFLVRTNSRFMITYSCGNIGGSSCAAYGAGSGWGSITGLVKSAKNIFAVGAMSTNDQLTGFSSRGPAKDGRILPDITATGPGGTSFASPNLAGVNAILTEAFRNSNNNQWPASGLIKAIILNTADDIENPGPDFRTGFGRVNAKRGLNVIQNAQIISDSVANNTSKTHTLNVPAGVSEVKVSLYWTDYEATAGITGKTLVNDLDIRVQAPNGSWTSPWILNTFPHNDSLILPATKGLDTLNNIELVSILNPTSGSYNVEVSGSLVPFGPQTYFIVYSYIYDSVDVVFPKGGEGLVSGETRRIRWDAFDNGNSFLIEFSADSGSTWQSISTGIASDLRTYTWTVPTVQSGACQIKIQSGSQIAYSNVFTIAPPPNNLQRVWRCTDSALVSWDSVPGALGYNIYRLGTRFMDTVGFVSTPFSKIYNLSSSSSEWISVQTVLPDSGTSRRAIALEIPTSNFNCVGTDLATVSVESPQSGYYPSCITSTPLPVIVKVQNTGTMSLNQLPVAYQLNAGPVLRDTLFTSLSSPVTAVIEFSDSISLINGTNVLKLWTELLADANPLNDTMYVFLYGYTSNSIALPYSQNFDSFTGCSTAWGCSGISCSLSQGWYNVPNSPQGDSIDWRTHSGGTGSGGTGPSGDHTTGNGNYLYLEGSGNGGSGCQNSVAMLQSPCIDLAQTNQPELHFWYHAFGNSIGALHVDVLSNGKWHEDVTMPIVGAQANQWIQYNVPLSAFTGESIIIRFRGITGSGWATDMALDDIEISTLPTADFTTVFDTLCLGQIAPLTNESSYGTSFNWNITPSSFSFTAGSNTSSSAAILPNDTGYYNVQLIATNSTGSDTVLKSQFFYVGDFSVVTIASNAASNAFCYLDTATFTATGHGGEYDFYLNNVLQQSGTSNTFTTSSFNNGDSVHVVNRINLLCNNPSDKIGVIKQPDYNGISLNSSVNGSIICEGDTIDLIAPSGFNLYEYLVNGTVVAASGSPVYSTSQILDKDSISCVLVDSLGCSGITNILVVDVTPTPTTPSVVLVGLDSLKAVPLANSYRWYKDGQDLNLYSQTIANQGDGLYTVESNEDSCWSAVSAPFQYSISGTTTLENKVVRIYPNPNKGVFWVETDPMVFNEVSVYNQIGKQVLKARIKDKRNAISLQNMATGLYLVRVSGQQGEIKSLISVN